MLWILSIVLQIKNYACTLMGTNNSQNYAVIMYTYLMFNIFGLNNFVATI